MIVVTVKGLSTELHRALKRRAAQNKRSAEAEVKAILEEVMLPPARLRIGSELVAFGRDFGGIDLDIPKDLATPRSADFERLFSTLTSCPSLYG